MQGSDSGSMSGSGDKSSPDDDIPTPDVCKAKILALLRYVIFIKARQASKLEFRCVKDFIDFEKSFSSDDNILTPDHVCKAKILALLRYVL